MADTNAGQQAVLPPADDVDIPGGSLTALRDFILTLPSEPAEQHSITAGILDRAPLDTKLPVIAAARKVMLELPLVCPEDEFHRLMKQLDYESVVPFNLSETVAVRPYDIYLEVMRSSPSFFFQKPFNADVYTIALKLGCAYQWDDGRITCPQASLECLDSFIRCILHKFQVIFVDMKWYAYIYAAYLQRIGMRCEGTAPNYTLHAIRPNDLELRDQHAYMAIMYTDEELLQHGVSATRVREFRGQSFYLFEDQRQQILERMELRRCRYLAAMGGNTNEHAALHWLDTVTLESFVLGRSPRDVEINAEHHLREREIIIRDRHAFEPVSSLVVPQVIAVFWRLVDTFCPLAQAILEAMPFWLVANSDYVALQEAQVDVCIKSVLFLKEQDLSRKGVRQLTGTPLYILSFEVLLDIVKSVHKLHRLVMRDLRLPEPVDLQSHPAWPTGEWLLRHGFNPDLGRLEHDQK